MDLFIDPYYLLFALPGLVLAVAAQAYVKSAFSKYSRVRASGGMTGASVARAVLDSNGLTDVGIEQVQGNLSDHYDPSARVLRLSTPVYGSNSVAAAGVAAHEAGHALQHASGYWALGLRTGMVPMVRFGPGLAITMFFIGAFMRSGPLQLVGIVLYGAIALFALVTLPVELNASRRAMAVLSSNGILTGQEARGARRVLTAAALTYVAAAVQAILTLLYMLSRRR